MADWQCVQLGLMQACVAARDIQETARNCLVTNYFSTYVVQAITGSGKYVVQALLDF